MAKPENGSFWSELLAVGLYKRNQGRLARQLTAAGLAFLVVAGTYVLSQGPLTGMANSWFRIMVSYSGEKDPAKDDVLRKVARENGAELAKISRDSKIQSLEFRVPTSWMWIATARRIEEGRKQADSFVAAVEGAGATYKVTVPQPASDRAAAVTIGIPAIICVLCGWVIYRLVNWPLFAEFLISVEAEMNKVSWASKQELFRATIVVLSTMLFLGVVLFVYDFVWKEILVALRVLQLG
jgi:preprotein translocase SecE subunit